MPPRKKPAPKTDPGFEDCTEQQRLNEARETGTPWKSIGIGYAAGLISSLFLTPFAALLITPLALYLAEYLRLRNRRQAFDSVKGWLVGFGWTFVALISIGALMIAVWLVWVWL